MKSLGNHTLAIGVASILALYASSVAMPALTVSTFAINNNDVLQFLIDVIQCFTNNNTNDHHDKPFSHDVKQCLYNVINKYFDNSNNHSSNNDTNNRSNSQHINNSSNSTSSNNSRNNNKNNNYSGSSLQEQT